MLSRCSEQRKIDEQDVPRRKGIPLLLAAEPRVGPLAALWRMAKYLVFVYVPAIASNAFGSWRTPESCHPLLVYPVRYICYAAENSIWSSWFLYLYFHLLVPPYWPTLCYVEWAFFLVTRLFCFLLYSVATHTGHHYVARSEHSF